MAETSGGFGFRRAPRLVLGHPIKCAFTSSHVPCARMHTHAHVWFHIYENIDIAVPHTHIRMYILTFRNLRYCESIAAVRVCNVTYAYVMHVSYYPSMENICTCDRARVS